MSLEAHPHAGQVCPEGGGSLGNGVLGEEAVGLQGRVAAEAQQPLLEPGLVDRVRRHEVEEVGVVVAADQPGSRPSLQRIAGNRGILSGSCVAAP